MTRFFNAVLALLLAVALLSPGAWAANTVKRIVLIGGAKSEGPARHDYPNGIRLLKAFLESSPDVRRIGNVVIDAYPDGWPADSSALEGAATLVWYFDGLDRHPLLDAARRAAFEGLMKRGVGLVAIHQAATVPGDDGVIGLPRWLGAARYGMFDRTTQDAQLGPSAPAHPISRGMKPFTHHDEYYPTFRRQGQDRSPPHGRPKEGLLPASLEQDENPGLGASAGATIRLGVDPRAKDTRGAPRRVANVALGGKARSAKGAHMVTPILRGSLQADFRDGRALVDDKPAVSTVAWAFERLGGGRSFAFSGAHYLTAFDEPALRRMLLNAIFWTAKIEVPKGGVRSASPDAATRLARTQTDSPTFHRDPQRTGLYAYEMTLTPERVASGPFGLIWESRPLDGVDGQPPRLYATPLYVDQVRLSDGERKGTTFPVVIAATNTGFVYAINAFRTRDIPPGTILWRTRLGAPCRLRPAALDGVPTGVLSTPVIDLDRRRIYVTHCDPENRWQAYALDLGSGAVLPGWPVRLDEATLNAVNKNSGPPVAPARRFDFRVQRGALNLSPDGAWLYVAFGETETGWIVAVDTTTPRVASAFASQAVPHRGGGGIWGAGGPAVDERGSVFVVTGTGYNGFVDRPNDWTQSVMMLSHSRGEGFVLRGTYTPFNHCATATMDIDLGSGGAALLPDFDPSSTATPRLLVVGGKQGNAYLLDRARLPGQLDRRPPCGEDSSSDTSLLPPDDQPQFGKRGPLNVFGPYSDKDAAMDVARGRSVPAYFRNADGKSFVFVTGNTKKEEGSPASVPPSLVRLEVVATPGKPAYLRVDQREMRFAFENPGSPFVTSNGPRDAIVWILDENARRSAPLAGPESPKPILYAFDAMTLTLLWKSEPGELLTSGKYNEPAFSRGTVFVGTDRVQAFGVGGRRAMREADALQPSAMRGETVAAQNSRDGGALYGQRCAVCHDHPQGSVPPREIIAKHSRQHIIETLTHGAMRPFAEGLGADEIEAVARYLQ